MKLPEPFRKLIAFAIVGLVSVVTYLGVTALVVSKSGVTIANIIAFLAAAFVSYIGHHSFTFRVQGNHDIHGPRFIVQGLLAYLVSLAITEGAAALHFHYMVGATAVAILVPIVNFVAFQFWVFANLDLKRDI